MPASPTLPFMKGCLKRTWAIMSAFPFFRSGKASPLCTVHVSSKKNGTEMAQIWTKSTEKSTFFRMKCFWAPKSTRKYTHCPLRQQITGDLSWGPILHRCSLPRSSPRHFAADPPEPLAIAAVVGSDGAGASLQPFCLPIGCICHQWQQLWGDCKKKTGNPQPSRISFHRLRIWNCLFRRQPVSSFSLWFHCCFPSPGIMSRFICDLCSP